MESPIGRVEGLAEAVREGKPLPPADLAVLEHSGAVAEDAGGWDGVAEIVVAAELEDRGFRMHRLADGADCRRDELLLGDYSLVCAAELATRMGRSDVDREFAEAARTAGAGQDYVPLLEPAAPVGKAASRSRSERARAATLAAVVECIHTATIVRDDLCDESPLRRGLRTSHLAYGPAAAVRVGDFYLGRAADLLGSLDNQRATRLVVEAVALVCQAQIDEFMQRGEDHLDEASYLRIVEGKTATRFAGACAAGAAVAGASDELIEALQSYGQNLGIAFQMVDDVLDFSTGSGKTLAQDLQQTVTSLPLVYAGEDPRVREQLAALRDAGDFDGEAAVALVAGAGALDRALRRARDYRDAAIAQLERLPEGETRDRLRAYADFAVERRS